MLTTKHFKLTICQILSSSATQIVNITMGCGAFNVNYYEHLGIPKTSTQSEIKTAYYRLSKLYHPDKNQGCDNAALKFREITQAYEVLGNFRLRRLYDRGIIYTGPNFSHTTEDAAKEVRTEDDASTKFYKSRFTKSKVLDSKGRTPIYNFDEWSKAHYGKSFERHQAAKKKYEHSKTEVKKNVLNSQNEILLCSIIMICGIVYIKFMAESSYDTPKEKIIKVDKESQNENDEI